MTNPYWPELPENPEIGQEVTLGGRIFTWSGVVWTNAPQRQAEAEAAAAALEARLSALETAIADLQEAVNTLTSRAGL